jgi:hypothetical protein
VTNLDTEIVFETKPFPLDSRSGKTLIVSAGNISRRGGRVISFRMGDRVAILTPRQRARLYDWLGKMAKQDADNWHSCNE